MPSNPTSSSPSIDAPMIFGKAPEPGAKHKPRSPRTFRLAEAGRKVNEMSLKFRKRNKGLNNFAYVFYEIYIIL